MIAKCGLPLSFTETEGFNHFLKEVAPLYKAPGRNAITTLMDTKYTLISSDLKNSFNNIDFFCLTTDVWTDPFTNKSYMSLTSHYLDTDKITLQAVSLGLEKLKERHTSEYLGKVLSDICKTWNIPDDRILCIVTDNGCNIKHAIHTTFGYHRHLPCFAHCLNLVAQKSIASSVRFQTIVTKVKHIVTHFKHSVRASDELMRLQMLQGKTEGTCLKLKQDCPTRWNSTFYMLSRFIEVVDIVSQVLLSETSSLEMITHEERKVIIDAIKILSPLEQITVEVSGEQYLTCSKIIPLTNCLIKRLEGKTPITDISKELHKNILQEVNHRFGPNSYIKKNEFLSIATLLDPRFKKIHFGSAMECANVINTVSKLMKNMHNNRETIEKRLTNNVDRYNENDIWNIHEEMKASVTFNNEESTSIPTELRQYLNSALLDRKDDPLKYWLKVKDVYPNLYVIAIKYFVVVGTSVPSERVFSKAGNLISQKRSKLLSERASKLLFLQSIQNNFWEKNM